MFGVACEKCGMCDRILYTSGFVFRQCAKCRHRGSPNITELMIEKLKGVETICVSCTKVNWNTDSILREGTTFAECKFFERADK